METYVIKTLLKQFALNQRWVNCSFRKEFSLNRTHIELLFFADSKSCFNAYEAKHFFKQMNLQQIRLGIKKLCLLRALELISSGAKGKPAIYVITQSGQDRLKSYAESWLSALENQS